MNLKTVLKVIVATVTLGIVFSLMDWHVLAAALARTSPVHLLLMFALDILAHIVFTLRWVVILGDKTSAKTRTVVRSYLYSTLLNLVTPANLGSDVYRFCTLTKDAPLERPLILGALFKERFLGLLGTILAFILCWGIWSVNPGPMPQAGIATLNSMGAIFLVSMPTAGLALWLISKKRIRLPMCLGATVHRWAGGIAAALEFPTVANAATLVLFSVVASLLWIVPVVLYAQALGASLPWTVSSMITVLVALAVFVPLSIQGVGVREGLFAALFAMCGSQSEIGFAVGVVSYLVLGLAMLTVGLLGLIPERTPRP